MRRVFKVGEIYYPYQEEYGPIKVVRRTDKSVWVEKENNSWRMKIYIDEFGNEFAVDNSVPASWRGAFTYFA